MFNTYLIKLCRYSIILLMILENCSSIAFNRLIYSIYYDYNGNTIAIDEIKDNQVTRIYEYGYNGLNQMVGFTNIQKDQTYKYTYYPDGRRSTKYTSNKTSSESIKFLYGHKGNLLNAEYSHNNQLQKRSSYFAGIRFVDNLINSNDSIFQLPLADRHNHPATISFRQEQSQIKSYHLTDYGQLSQSNTHNNTNGNVSNNGSLIDFSLNPKVYGSGYYDPESKLQYMGARYYSADSHRFMAQDSYNLLNRYNYANANPVMNYDPSGHKSIANIFKDIVPHDQKSFFKFAVLAAAGVAVGVGVEAISFSSATAIGTVMPEATDGAIELMGFSEDSIVETAGSMSDIGLSNDELREFGDVELTSFSDNSQVIITRSNSNVSDETFTEVNKPQVNEPQSSQLNKKETIRHYFEHTNFGPGLNVYFSEDKYFGLTIDVSKQYPKTGIKSFLSRVADTHNFTRMFCGRTCNEGFYRLLGKDALDVVISNDFNFVNYEETLNENYMGHAIRRIKYSKEHSYYVFPLRSNF